MAANRHRGLGFGFVVAKVSLIVDPGTQGVSDEALDSGVGVAMVLSGAALVVFGYRRHATVAQAVNAQGEAPARWPRTIAVAAAIGALMLAALIIITT